ncbi:MAG TPA: DUF4906 domain-containing protein [Candidatus Bacteroides merdigallinarum]|uniref:DUF4906 domain-containing protein n=1 Tax=Candidatus Bacteroides merdigallinarum TaxID=2838473 RepID=A0A9D2E730_9BACE|nr:DUF4906 domain-containing protein [Candidatus Bacteroides merdigallinarum]
MKKILTLLCALATLAACQDDLAPDNGTGATAEGLTDIYLAQTGMPVIVTRNGEAATTDDNRVESVILFVFNEQGALLNTPVQQSVTQVAAPSGVAEADKNHTFYRFRAYLPKEKHSLHAVCNYDADEASTLIESISGEHTSDTDLDALKAATLQISSVDEAYKGVYLMEGSTSELKGTITIPVKRVVSRHTFTVTFAPEKEGDQFKLSSMSLFNVPAQSKLVQDEYVYETHHTQNWENDAVYFQGNSAQTPTTIPADYYLGTDPGDYPEKAGNDDFVSGTEMLDVTQGTDQLKHETYTATAHLFENRRGGLSAEEVHTALQLTDYPEDERERIRQLFKRDLATNHSSVYRDKDDYYPCATCLVIEGIYDRAGENSFTSKVRYFVYLGRDNFGDFNVERNTDYRYEITISAADEIDTRIATKNLDQLDFSVSKQDRPFDAHYNVREALIYASNAWEVYVENPDETPWLEVSTSPVYHARALGASQEGDDNGRAYAQFRLTGSESLKYIYIHTDEYVPHRELAEATLTANGQLKPRTGTIVAKCGTVEKRFTVTQYPAQLVSVQENNIAGMGTGQTRYFFVERITEEKYKDWGFRGFWNLTLDNLISTGYYDGLSNTRKEYVSAFWGDKDSDSFDYRTKQINDPAPLELDGAQDAAYWQAYNEDGDFIQPEGNAIFNLSTSFALGYALAKNRDRNGNGRIDYNEILWYLPARKQLQAIAKAINSKQLYGTDTDDVGNMLPLTLDGSYWSSTPSVSDKYGITTGRAYYVKMDAEGSEAIGLRDQSFNVIVCRDAEDVWYGPETGSGQGDVNLHPGWEDEDENMPGK